MIKPLLTFFFLIMALGMHAQDKSNKGKEFWLGYGHNVLFTQDPPYNTQTHVLYLSAEQAATVTVSVNGTAWSQTVTIAANTVDYSIIIPKTGADDARLLSEGLSTKGIHIVSDVPIVAYSHQYGLFSSAATMLMPVETFGYTYYSINFTQVSNYVDSYSWFYAVAAEDNTRLTITPSDNTEGGWLAGQAYTVNLNKGQIYNVFGKKSGTYSSKDMTGSKIVSVPGSDGNCHPVAVFSGSSRNIICNGNGGEILQQQIFPANAWGTKYITYHTINNAGGNILTPFTNIYRVAVRNPATVVKRNGTVLTGLVNNFYYEYTSNAGDVIEADQPVMVAQFTLSSNECITTASNPMGDPEMIYLSPIEQGVKKAIFYNTRNQAISLNYVNIIVPVTGLNTVLIDGTAVLPSEYITHPANPNYVVIVRRLTGLGAQHSITCDETFIATNYGAGITESYGYNVGTLVNNLNSYTSIKNTFNTNGTPDTFTCPKTPMRLFVKVAYQLTSIHWKLSQATGLTPNTDSIINNPVPTDSAVINGRKYFTYTLQQDFIFANPGTYFIPVSYTAPEIDQCNNVENTSIPVIVKTGPVANFNIAGSNCLRDTIMLTGASIPGVFNLSSHLWNFDDNTTQTTVDAKKKFAVDGTQNIRYRIFADNGCAGDTTKTITIFPQPVSKISMVNSAGCTGDSFSIQDSSTISGGTINKWYYDLGDGNTLVSDTSIFFWHSYSIAGTYTVKLVTRSNNNCTSDTAFRILNIVATPLAEFTSNNIICEGDSIQITDISSIASDTIISREYNFGDGNTVVKNTNTPFFHTYKSAGMYVISLTATSNMGCESIAYKKTISVNKKPIANISFSGNQCVGNNITFTSGYTNTSNTTWFWNFGDGQTANISTGNTTTHAYSSPQTNLVVKHVVSVGQGCASDTSFTTIPVINQTPVASFSILKDTVCENKPVQFSSTLTGISTWNWDFGNGTGSAAPPFTRTYSAAGGFNISLIVTHSNGCSSLPVKDSLLVHSTPIVYAGTDKTIQTGAPVTMDATVTPPAAYSYLWTPSAGLSAANILQPAASPAVTTTYHLSAEGINSHCSGKDSVVIMVLSQLQLLIPNAFTPNGDNTNDRWNIPGMVLYPDGLVTIFNRYGQIIHQTKNYISNPWNGTFKGKQQPAGSYIYTIELNDSKKQFLKGTVTIIR